MSSADDFLTAGYQEVHPAVPGPTPTGPYEYLSVVHQNALLTGQRPDMRALYYFIETCLLNVGYVERIDLINEVRVYRMQLRHLWRFQHDLDGPFVRSPIGIHRFLVDDPTVNIKAVNEWTPVGW